MARYARVAAVVLVQLAILVAVPFRQVRARLRGTPVTLRTAPVDPFDAFAGHYVTLWYEVEQAPPRFVPAGVRRGDPLWITLAQGDPAWTLVSVTRQRPAPASGHVSIQGRWEDGWRVGAVIDGARRFYVTEGRGQQVDAARRGQQSALVDLRVGDDGTPSIVGLRAGGLVLRDE